MHPASLSVKLFGAYVSFTGIGLVLAPGLVLSLLGVPPPSDVWIRVLGALAVVLGYYYWACGSAGAIPFIRASVVGRFAFAALGALLRWSATKRSVVADQRERWMSWWRKLSACLRCTVMLF
jgi:hypothetical protein